jgi:heme A synthase
MQQLLMLAAPLIIGVLVMTALVFLGLKLTRKQQSKYPNQSFSYNIIQRQMKYQFVWVLILVVVVITAIVLGVLGFR